MIIIYKNYLWGVIMSKIEIIIGTYGTKNEENIILYEMDLSTLNCKKRWVINDIENASYLYLEKNKNILYSVIENNEYLEKIGGGLIAYKLHKTSKPVKITSVNTGGKLPCHLMVDQKNKYAYVSNYLSGNISMFEIDIETKSITLVDTIQHYGKSINLERQEGPHTHFVSLEDEDKLCVVDLGTDSIIYYRIDSNRRKLLPLSEKIINFPKGSGPRHFVCGKNGIKYVVCELSSEVIVVDFKGKILQRISTLMDSKIKSTCAAIKIDLCNNFLYASNRGDDSIAVFKILENFLLELIQIKKVLGKTPRDFTIFDNYIFVGCQDSDCINIFSLENGKIKNLEKKLYCKKPSCILISKSLK